MATSPEMIGSLHTFVNASTRSLSLHHFASICQPRCNLASTNVRPLFPLLGTEQDTLDEPISKFLAQAARAGRRVVLITFSSMPVGERTSSV